jgi:hypothetical protein
MKRIWLYLAPVMIFAGSALANPYTCASFSGFACAQNTGTLTSIDHHDIYTWGFNSLNLAGKTITGATIAFSQITNWDTNVNRLDIDLLDSPKSANTVASGGAVNWVQVNTNSGDIPMANWNDDFLHNNTNVGTNLGQGDFRYSLTAMNSAAYGMVGIGTNLSADYASDLGHAGTMDATHSFNGPGHPSNYTYTFTAADLTKLALFINNGGDFAFGFNEDCHFYDSSVTFQMTVASTPEPGSIVLLITGLAAMAYAMRKRRAALGTQRDSLDLV